MRHPFKSNSSHGADRHSYSVVAFLTLLSVILPGVIVAQPNAIPFDNYRGNQDSVRMWKSRHPKSVDRLEKISSPEVFEIVAYLQNSRRFHEVIEKLERDRRQLYTWHRGKGHVPHSRGRFVRETAVVVWIPKNGSGLGLYQQDSGEAYSYGEFSDRLRSAWVSTPCDVTLTGEAAYHIRLHTHPLGTVPSMVDLHHAIPGLVDIVVSEKKGTPMLYVYSASGTSWELPTALFLPRGSPYRETEMFVAEN